jgi:hypothetical protein
VQRGLLDATTDLDRINGWWRAISDLNIGIATGGRGGRWMPRAKFEKFKFEESGS